jgi:hypothetical protein
MDARAGLASGAITVTFRNWRRPLARVGSHHKVGDTVLAIDRVDRVRVGDITAADAARAGGSVADVRTRLAGRGAPLGDDDLVYRVEFHRAGSFDALVETERTELDADELAALVARLDRLDRASPHGPWTRATLRLIAARPGVVSTDLAAELGRDRPSFKVDVRKLKRLGLTYSLERGYRVTPKGEAVLATLAS